MILILIVGYVLLQYNYRWQYAAQCCLTCMLQQVSVITWMRFRPVLYNRGALRFLVVVWNSLQHP